MSTEPTRFPLGDNRELCVVVEVDRWSVWVRDDRGSQVVGCPLWSVLMETLGMAPAHQEPTEQILTLARRIRAAIPREAWPSVEPEEDPGGLPGAS